MQYEFNQFNSLTYGQLDFDQACQKLLDYVSIAPGMEYELIIGTDSLLYANNMAEFVSAIIVHRKRSGGIYFWTKKHETHMHSLRQRIFQEALESLRLAEQLIEKLKLMNIQDFNLSIHVDVGPNGETKKMVNEIVGMIRGSGFNVKTKPDSYGASSVADRHT
jgi:predicted RNase H-related nuclease YkuK (DUF458 family)